MKAKELRDRLVALADKVSDDYDVDAIAPTLNITGKLMGALEKVVGYCADKADPSRNVLSPARLQSRAARAKARGRSVESVDAD